MSDNPRKMNAKLPEAPDDGFAAIHGKLLSTARERRRFVTVAVWDVSHGTEDYDTGEVELKIRLRRVEPVDGRDAEQALAMLDAAFAKRMGQPVAATLGYGNDD